MLVMISHEGNKYISTYTRYESLSPSLYACLGICHSRVTPSLFVLSYNDIHNSPPFVRPNSWKGYHFTEWHSRTGHTVISHWQDHLNHPDNTTNCQTKCVAISNDIKYEKQISPPPPPLPRPSLSPAVRVYLCL